MTVPWQQQLGPPVCADEIWLLHFIAADDYDDWGTADDWQRLHADFQHHGIPYRVIVSPQLPPQSDEPLTDETSESWFAFANPSLLR